MVDAWEQEAVYMLHADYSIIYVGVASGTKLGLRLRGHRDDHLAGRWDQFSWYGALPFSTPAAPVAGAAPITPGAVAGAAAGALVDALREVEALMIRAAHAKCLEQEDRGPNRGDTGAPSTYTRSANAFDGPWQLSLMQRSDDIAERLTEIEAKLDD